MRKSVSVASVCSIVVFSLTLFACASEAGPEVSEGDMTAAAATAGATERPSSSEETRSVSEALFSGCVYTTQRSEYPTITDFGSCGSCRGTATIYGVSNPGRTSSTYKQKCDDRVAPSTATCPGGSTGWFCSDWWLVSRGCSACSSGGGSDL